MSKKKTPEERERLRKQAVAKASKAKADHGAPEVVQPSEALADPSTLEVAPYTAADLTKLAADEITDLAEMDKQFYEPLGRWVRATDGIHNTGLIVHGPRGTGKTSRTKKALEDEKRTVINLSARVSATGIRERMQKTPTGTLFAEDVEDLAGRDKRVIDLLRPALWGEQDEQTGRMVRVISPATAGLGEGDDFEFEGAVIMTMNDKPRKLLPEVEAYVDRIILWEVNPSPKQLWALAHFVATKGYHTTGAGGAKEVLTPEQTCEMWARCKEAWPPNVMPSLRFIEINYRLRLENLARGGPDDWKEVMDLLLLRHQDAKPPLPPVSRKMSVEAEAQVARALYARYKEKGEITREEMLRLWAEASGGQQESYFYKLVRREAKP
jgi:hypothetical protein